MIVQFSPTVNGAITVVARLVGLAVFAGFLSAGVALCYRWYVRERVPSGLALLVGLAGVAIVLNTTPLLAAEIAADDEALEIVGALFNIVAFAGSAAAAFAGVRFGDHLGADLDAAGGASDVNADVSEIVQTVGRVTSVELPDEIADIVGYDPVSDATKETLAGRRFLFPRRLTKAEVRERLVSRLKTDYGVGHVDVEFGDDGSVEFLAVGSRAAGIGPTLPPATNAVAIRADPAHAASAGDLVQVWETDPMGRVLTGELRGVAGDVVTVAIDAADTPKLNPSERYKLVTLPVQNRPDREFASLLRAADETLATVTVEAGSRLDGVALDALDVTVAAITREDETPEPLPARSRTLQADDVVYVIARPEILRKVENAAEGPEGAVSSAGADRESVNLDSEPAGRKPDLANQDTATADLDDGSGGADDTVSDRPSAKNSDTDDVVTDADSRSGDAFVDTDELPGTDSAVETPSISGEQAGESGDEKPDEHGDDVGTNESDVAPEETDSVDDAFDPMAESPDADGPDDAGRGSDDSVDALTDAPADGVSTDEFGDETSSDDSVPYTPFDVGDDDPLADALTESDTDGDEDADREPEH